MGESIDSILAKNLVVARVIAGVTQQQLAKTSGISRATIAQLETGYSDPRLSTIAQLAEALDVPPLLLLIGQREARALATFVQQAAMQSDAVVNEQDLAKMRRLVGSGMLKDRVRAARVGAETFGAEDASTVQSVSTAILSAIYPGPGTIAGRALGRLLDRRQSHSTKTQTQAQPIASELPG